MFKDREEIEALQIGNVDFIAPSVSKFGPVGINDFEVFDLPYLFEDISELNIIVKGDIGRMLLRKLERKNIYGLGYWFNGFKNFTANKDISNVKNFRGLKMRIQSSKVIESYMRHLKTFPQVLPFSETYTALQQGVVNGTENSLSNLYTQKNARGSKSFANVKSWRTFILRINEQKKVEIINQESKRSH